MMLAVTFGIPLSVIAQTLELPDGYRQVVYETGWINGSDQGTQCANFVRLHHPGAQWKILDSGEDQKFENEILRIDSRYKYWCKLLIKE